MDTKVMERVANLAARYPGATVRVYSEAPSGCRLDMHIGNLVSMARLVVGASVSNVKCEVFAHRRPSAVDYTDPALLIYRFSTPEVASPSHYHSAMELFGIDMAHDLRDYGILDDDEAEALVASFRERLVL